MNARALIRMNEALDVLPFSQATLYTHRCRGKLKWLTRVGPHGHRTRELWIDVQSAITWWCIDGKPHVAELLRGISEGGASR